MYVLADRFRPRISCANEEQSNAYPRWHVRYQWHAEKVRKRHAGSDRAHALLSATKSCAIGAFYVLSGPPSITAAAMHRGCPEFVEPCSAAPPTGRPPAVASDQVLV
jgi:hypothetical protein